MENERRGPLFWLVCALMLLGLVVRIGPLLDWDTRILYHYPTEDGYLMLTIARNLAIGNGFSVADGTIPTNGTQPLTTLIWALGFWMTGGDKTAGVAVAQVILLVVSVLTAFLLYRLGCRMFAQRASGPQISMFAASAWFASPLVIPHSMNCLETGVYGLAVVLVAHVFLEPERQELWSVKKCLGVGVLLGAAFWVRNDAAFLILAACLVHLFNGLDQLGPRFRRTLIFGSMSVFVASPWLAFNQVYFDHIMPVSGRAESLTGHFASNLRFVPPVLAEYATLVIPIPHGVQDTNYSVAATSLFLVLTLPLLSLLWARATATERSIMVLTGIFLGALVVFYGLFFGAFWFLPRYFFPASPLLALATAAVGLRIHKRVTARVPAASWVFGLGLLGVIGAVQARAYKKGAVHMHGHVVQWIDQNLTKETWVGAIQTGTVGYFHDRTINLDGKVNIHAYRALTESRIADYVVDETEIAYLADWVGMLDWRTMPRIDENFEVVVADYKANLGVLKRKTRTSTTP